MPRYRWQVTVPAKTDESDAVSATVQIDEPVITDGLVFAPPGADGEVFAQIRFGDRIIFPTPGSSALVLPGTTDAGPINVEMPGTPNELSVRAWAPDADFQHTVTARVDAVSDSKTVQDVRLTNIAQTAQQPTETPSPQDIRDAGDE